MKPEYSDKKAPSGEVFLTECLAWGLLRAHSIEGPPVPVREMITRPLPIFERLTLLELNLGLYDAAYKSCLDGSQLIVVDLTKPRVVRRAGMARALYMAFCRSSRAAELGRPGCEQPHTHGNLFARCLLMPAAWVRQTCAEDTSISPKDLAARFDVPVRMAIQRLSELDGHTPFPTAEPDTGKQTESLRIRT